MEKSKRTEKKNKGRSDPNDLEAGDPVLIRNRDRTSKLDTCFVGPFIVVERVGFGSYEVRAIENGKISRVSRVDTVEFDEKREFVCLLDSDDQAVGETMVGECRSGDASRQ